MEKEYNDSLIPERFEEMAKAYSQSLKKQGFVFVRLEDEEFNLLSNEILIILEKIKACLKKLEKQIDSAQLRKKLDSAQAKLCEKFNIHPSLKFKYSGKENAAFLCLVGLENLLITKLLLLAIKSGELELCHTIISSICNVISQGLNLEGFVCN